MGSNEPGRKARPPPDSRPPSMTLTRKNGQGSPRFHGPRRFSQRFWQAAAESVRRRVRRGGTTQERGCSLPRSERRPKRSQEPEQDGRRVPGLPVEGRPGDMNTDVTNFLWLMTAALGPALLILAFALLKRRRPRNLGGEALLPAPPHRSSICRFASAGSRPSTSFSHRPAPARSSPPSVVVGRPPAACLFRPTLTSPLSARRPVRLDVHGLLAGQLVAIGDGDLPEHMRT